MYFGGSFSGVCCPVFKKKKKTITVEHFSYWTQRKKH